MEELERHLKTEHYLADRTAELAGHVGALGACVEMAMDYARLGMVPSDETVSIWRKALSDAKAKR